MRITRYESYYNKDHTLSWNSQEELADKINDTLKLIQTILDNPIIQPSEYASDRPIITLRDISTDASVSSAYGLLASDRTRKISDFTPEF